MAVLDHAADVRPHQAAFDIRIACQAARRQIVDTADGAIHLHDPEPAQPIEMKADHVEWLASIADRFEAAVPVREQASLSESEEQLTGGPLDDRGTRDRRPRSDRGKSLGCAVGLEAIRLTAPANESAVIRQLGNQPDVAASVFEQREQVVAGQPGKPGIVGVGRRACQVREVVSAWEPIETSRRSQPPRAQAIAKHAEGGVIRNARAAR